MNDDQHWTAVARYLAGESPAEEQAYVRKWLAEDPRNQKLIDALGRATSSVALTPPADIDVERALAKVHLKLDQADVVPLSSRRPGRSWVPAVAAAALVGIVGGSAWFALQFSGDFGPESPITAPGWSAHTNYFSTPSRFQLRDGTGVVLAPGSVLRVQPGYPATREVALRGEAQFDVRHVDGAPDFTVHTATAVVRDLGTTFVVREDAGGTRVSVTQGSVTVRGAESRLEGDTLRAGERGIFSNSTLTVGALSPADTAWVSGTLQFADASMDRVKEDLRRWYHVELVVDSALARRHLTASFAGDSLPRVLDVIALALGARIERRGDTAFVRSR